jgi:AcrR family transcriptional regulator
LAATAEDGRDLARARRREELLDAADRSVRRHGHDVSMDAIAAEAGITKPVLYRHFGDREGLLAAMASRHARRLVVELRTALAAQEHPRERIRTTMDTYLGFLERDPELHRFATRVAPLPRDTEGADATRDAGSDAHGVGGGDGRGGALPVGVAAMDDALGAVCDQVIDAVRRELTGAGLDPTPACTWGEGMVGMVQLVGNRWIDEEAGPDRAELVGRLTDLLWSGFRGIVLRDTGTG